jgi:ABC-type Mn2+/Zn2+ transport system permease subunit
VSVTARALLEAVLLGAACGPLGLWVLAYRQAYAAESLSHAMLPGLAVAAVAGAPLLLGAAGGIVAAAALVALAARDRRIGADLAVAVTITAVFGAGILVASAPDAPPRLAGLLFGDLLGVSDADLVAAALLALLTPAALAAGHRPLTAAAALDADAARSIGVRPAAVQAGLLVALALAIVVAVQGLGNLLVVALLVAPAIAAGRLAPALGSQLVVAAVLGAASGALGVLASDRLSLAAGASVALAACLIALAAVVLRPPRAASRGVRRSPIEALGGAPR